MTPENILCIIIALFLFDFFLGKVLGYLNKKHSPEILPKQLKGIYSAKEYKKSQEYGAVRYKFGLLSSSLSFIITLAVLVFGGFGWLDEALREYTQQPILLALAFFAVISFLQTLFSLPFSYYSTFVIEEKFGFNKTTKKTFFTDIIKSLFLSAVLGGGIMAAVIWIYGIAGENFWWYAWILISGFSIFMMMFYSSLIVPLFNKQTPLEDGKLRKAIEKFASSVDFKVDNIFVIDGSKRSSKANAYFAGFGPKKRICLYDTLIDDLTTDEVVAVLAHEIGHYKRKHTIQMLAFSVLQTGFMLFVLGLALRIPEVSQSLGAEVGSFHVGIIAFGVLFSPIGTILGLLGNILSRKNEYEADAYAKEHHKPKKLISSLKKLSKKSLSNLTPHPAYEFFYYSHPTSLKRFDELEK